MTTRLIISFFVAALLLLLLWAGATAARYYAAISVGIGALSGFCSGLAAGRRSSAIGSAGHRLPRRARQIVLFFGPSDFFSVVSYFLRD